ncbi:MAG: serine hydrolase [Minisyncoccia bacterium]
MNKNTTQEEKVEKLDRLLKRYKIVVFIIGPLFLIAFLCLYRPLMGSYLFSKSYKLLDPARQYSPADNYIINIEDLRNYLNDLGEKYPDQVSMYYEQVKSGANISIHKELQLFPASLSKLVQAILITKKVEDGALNWNTRLKTEPSDISNESGTLYQTIGTNSLTVEELMSELLVNSDNTAYNTFKHSLNINDYVNFQLETGLQDLYNIEGHISAKEYTRLLRVLYTSSYLEPKDSEKILQYMADAKFKDFLSQGLPKDVMFAHKYSVNKDEFIFADSGIVYVPGKPYFITVIIKGKDFSPQTQEWAKGLMRDISIHAYNVSK